MIDNSGMLSDVAMEGIIAIPIILRIGMKRTVLNR